MMTPLNIVSLHQGRMPVDGEESYYRLAPEWKAPMGLGRFLGWVMPARGPDRESADSTLADGLPTSQGAMAPGA